MIKYGYEIEEYDKGVKITPLNVDEFNVDKTLDCGQAFRWKKSSLGNNFWYGAIGDEIVTISHQKFQNGEDGIVTNISLDNIDKFMQYFNLDMNYSKEIRKLTLDSYALKCYEYGKGIHILRQDLFETLVTFLMSQFNNMHNIRLIVNRLAERYGNKIETDWRGEHLIAYSFPTPEKLAECNVDDFKECRIGLRSQYLYDMCQFIMNNKYYLQSIRESNYQDSIIKLKIFNGIGDKVANCVALFSLHHIEAFPIDVHINRIIEDEYNGDIDLTQYGNIAGIIQQYMFYYKAFN